MIYIMSRAISLLGQKEKKIQYDIKAFLFGSFYNCITWMVVNKQCVIVIFCFCRKNDVKMPYQTDWYKTDAVTMISVWYLFAY